VLGREHADPRLIGALALSSSGLVLVIAGAGTGALDPLGVALALAAACVYSAYILVSEGVSERVRPQLLSALVCSGAAVTLTIGSLALGELKPGDLSPAGWGWMACIALISTVLAVSLFFAGLRRAGASSAAILSTVEPLVTVVLAYFVFGEHLTGAQMLGGALVLGGVIAVSTRPRAAAVRPTRARREGLAATEPG
jgi:drug/metabolite transporter (DMT)-like permease